jgi:hypothetical protein
VTEEDERALEGIRRLFGPRSPGVVPFPVEHGRLDAATAALTQATQFAEHNSPARARERQQALRFLAALKREQQTG